MAKREYTEQIGKEFFKTTVTSPPPGSVVTLQGIVPEGDNVGHDLDNIPIMVGERSITVPALAIEECVKRVPCEAPKRLDEPQAP